MDVIGGGGGQSKAEAEHDYKCSLILIDQPGKGTNSAECMRSTSCRSAILVCDEGCLPCAIVRDQQGEPSV